MSGRVLLVEDDGMIREMVAEGLREHGFDVVEAASGREAWAHFEAAPSGFDALVVDVELPGEDAGDQLARRIRQQQPALPIVVTSGRISSLIEAHRAQDASEEALAQDQQAADPIPGRTDYLSKPYTLAGLIRTLRQQLERSG